MELLKMFFKDEVPAVGLTRFKIKKEKHNSYIGQKLNFSRPVFKPNYSNNFFLL
jgi:hypothetical protein